MFLSDKFGFASLENQERVYSRGSHKLDLALTFDKIGMLGMPGMPARIHTPYSLDLM